MKSILVLTCCLALASVAAADQNKHKNKAANQVQGQQVQQQAVIKPGRHAARTGLQTNTGVQGQQLQTNSQLRMGGGGGKNRHLSTSGSTNTQITKNKNFTKNVTKVNVKNFNVTKNFNNKYQAVKFQPGVRFKNSSNWKGNNYIVFRNYSPSWHDRFWWENHHNRIVLIGGGWYYWDSNYWYPAWGYDPGARYVYDGPIYAYHDMDPGQVVANVQSALQQQGYYEGEVDGLMGPLTRAALARYQADHGLYETAAIDQPTLEALGFA
jgi:hypothetical protein